MPTTQLAPVLFARAAGYRLQGRVHFPKDAVGDLVRGPDEDFVVFRKMVLDPPDDRSHEIGADFTVKFHFAHLSAAANRRLSLLPAPFIAAQPGFRSKTWLLGQKTGMFQGVYEWESVEQAEAYWTSFPMRMMKRRAVPESLWHEVTPRR